MALSKQSFQKLVNGAYGFFIILSLAWLVTSGVNNHKLNVAALVLLIVFGVQAYVKHLFANLIIGILTLFFSIYNLLDAIDAFVTTHKPLAFGIFSCLAILSIVCSLIMIFSYKKLNLE